VTVAVPTQVTRTTDNGLRKLTSSYPWPCNSEHGHVTERSTELTHITRGLPMSISDRPRSEVISMTQCLPSYLNKWQMDWRKPWWGSKVDGGSWARPILRPGVDVSPNSEATVRQALDYVLHISDNSNLKWKCISCVCDGCLFTIALKIIRDDYVCNHCQQMFRRKEIHCNLKKMLPEAPEYSRKCNRVIMRPGNGHFEINIVRGIFTNFLEAYIKPVAEMLGFTTLRAL